ncbi:MAG TPA: hypothetical protein VGK90_14170 [Rhizomicrobium sp.]
MHENHLLAGRKNKIGPAGQVGSMQPKTIAGAVSDSPDEQLGLCILAADERHARAALARRERVHQAPLA